MAHGAAPSPVGIELALLVRGVGLGAMFVPSASEAYASIPKPDLPMASTTLNIVQRLGGPLVTTALATLLAGRLAADPGATASRGAFTLAFGFLVAVHGLALLAVARLPRSAKAGPVEAPDGPGLLDKGVD